MLAYYSIPFWGCQGVLQNFFENFNLAYAFLSFSFVFALISHVFRLFKSKIYPFRNHFTEGVKKDFGTINQ